MTGCADATQKDAIKARRINLEFMFVWCVDIFCCAGFMERLFVEGAVLNREKFSNTSVVTYRTQYCLVVLWCLHDATTVTPKMFDAR